MKNLWLLLLCCGGLASCQACQTVAYAWGFDTPMERRSWAAKEQDDIRTYAASAPKSP